MKTNIFYFIFVVLFAENIFAQEQSPIQITAKPIVEDGIKYIELIFTNTVDKNVEILTGKLSVESASYLNFFFSDNNGRIVSQTRYIAPLRVYIDSQGNTMQKNLIIKTGSSERIKIAVDYLTFEIRERDHARYERIKKFSVEYKILYRKLNEDSSVLSTHHFRGIIDQIDCS